MLKQLNTVFSCLVGQAAFVSTKRHLVLQPMPVGAAVRNVTSNSSQCICTKTVYHNDHTIYTFVSYSAANISVIARNDVSVSPPAILQVPAEPASDLEGRRVKCIDINIVYIYVQVDHKAEFLSGSLQQNFGRWRNKQENLSWVVRASRCKSSAKKCDNLNRKDG